MLRTIGVLTIVAAVILGIGFAAGWFRLGSETHAGETEVTFRVDREEVSEDVASVKRRVGRDENPDTDPTPLPDGAAVPEVPAAVAGRVDLTGYVLRVEPATATLALRLATGEERTLILAPESTSHLEGVAAGDQVNVVAVTENGRSRILELREI